MGRGTLSIVLLVTASEPSPFALRATFFLNGIVQLGFGALILQEKLLAAYTLAGLSVAAWVWELSMDAHPWIIPPLFYVVGAVALHRALTTKEGPAAPKVEGTT